MFFNLEFQHDYYESDVQMQLRQLMQYIEIFRVEKIPMITELLDFN